MLDIGDFAAAKPYLAIAARAGHQTNNAELLAFAMGFVDDTEHNLPPATALGMATVYFTDPATGVDDIATALDIP